MEYMRHKNSQSSSSTSMLTHHKTKLSFLNDKQNIIISPPLESDRFQILAKVHGDLSIVDPETEKNESQRFDMYKNPIIRGSKGHKVSFRDQFSKKLTITHYYARRTSDTEDDCCPCMIF